MHRRAFLVRLLSLTTVLFALAPGPTWAESEEPLEVKEVVVSSTRLPGEPIDAHTLPANVTVITAEDIRKSGAKTVQEAIQWATGIVMYDSIGNAFQQTIDLRGFNGQPVPGTSVFVDGVRINEPDFNTINFDLIPFDTIERIEILPGASAIYGKNAVGGVVNIITKRGGEKHQITGDALWGSFQRQRYTIDASGPIGKFDYHVNFGREMEDGFRDDSGARISRFTGRFGYRPSAETDLSVSYNYVQDKLHQAGQIPLESLGQGVFNRKANVTPTDFDDKELNFVRVTGRQKLPLGFSLNGNAFYRGLNQDLTSVGQPFFCCPGPPFPSGTTQARTRQGGGTAQLSHDATPFGHRNQFVAGGELIRNNFDTHFSSASGMVDTTAKEHIGAGYVHDTFHLLPHLLLNGGFRYDYDRIEVDSRSVFFGFPSGQRGTLRYHRTTPRGGITYLFSDSFSTYYSYSEGFRVPTTLEMFTSLGQPNLTLQPIHSKNHEIGFKGRFGSVAEGSIAFFQSNSNDIFFTCTICNVLDPAFNGQNRNADAVRRQGVETTLKVRWNEYVDATINYTYTEAEFRSALDLPFPARMVQKGDEFPLVPRHRVGGVLTVRPTKDSTVSLTGLYLSSQVFLNDESNDFPRLPGYFVLNMRATYKWAIPGGQLTVFALVNNFTDNKYATFGSISPNNLTGTGALERWVVPAPGIAAYGGLSYRFEGL